MIDRIKDRPRPTRGLGYAAVWDGSHQSRADILEVARKHHGSAGVYGVSGLGALLVRSVDEHSEWDYDIVHLGERLVYSERFDSLFTQNAESFEREYEVLTRF